MKSIAKLFRSMTPLTPRDAQQFKHALTLYEKREYEQCLAEVDQVIARRATNVHGESLCLKALVLLHLKRDGPESDALMRDGTKADSDSHVAWHMAGIYHKLRKEYAEAYKCYMNSYRLNRDNGNVHQDLAMLAAHERDFGVLVDVRRQMLTQKMSVRMSWSALAAAQFVAKDYAGVCQTVKLYDEVMGIERKQKEKLKKADEKKAKKGKDKAGKGGKGGNDKASGKTGKDKASKKGKDEAESNATQQQRADEIELSEMLMLRSRALLELHKYAELLEDLANNENEVLDKLAWQETRAMALAAVDAPKGRDAFLQLMKRNPENRLYYEQLEKLSSNWSKLYADVQARFPKSDLAFGRPLVVFSPDPKSEHFDSQWSTNFANYVTPKLAKNVPSTFRLVESLYKDPAKGKAIAEFVDATYVQKKELSASERIFVARHYAAVGDMPRGIVLLDEYKDAGDLQIDVDFAKAHLYDLVGAFHVSAEIWEKWSADLPGDRALNTGAARAMFRANDVAAGYRLAYKFPIWGKYAENDEEALNHIISVESVNVLLQMATAHHRRGEDELALKRALKVLDIYKLYYDEQYDFHFYGPRRNTLRTYADLVAWEDTLYTSPSFLKALEIVIDVAKGDDLEGAVAYWKLLEQFTLKAGGDMAYVHWLGFVLLLSEKKYVLANQQLKKAKDSGLSSSKLAAGGLMARHTLETDGQAPQVLRSVQLKLLPAVVTAGDIVGSDPIEYANTYVTDFLDWVAVRKFIGQLDEPRTLQKVAEITDNAETAEKVWLLLRTDENKDRIEASIKEQWPLETFTVAYET